MVLIWPYLILEVTCKEGVRRGAGCPEFTPLSQRRKV